MLIHQQADPLCSKCKACVNTVFALREGLDGIKSEHADKLNSLSGEISGLLEEARTRITSIKTPENTTGQKKAGNCKMPHGICFIKSSKAILENI